MAPSNQAYTGPAVSYGNSSFAQDAPAQQRERDIPQALESAEGALKSLAVRVDALLSRLEPASHSRPPQANSPVAKECPMRSPIADRLTNLAASLESLETQVNLANQLLQL